MTARCLALVLALALAAPSGALAQQGGGGPGDAPGGGAPGGAAPGGAAPDTPAPGGTPFGPLPQTPPPPPEEPEPQPADFETEEDGLGGTAFWLIVGTTAAIFLGIGFLITRDMRRSTRTQRRKPKKRVRSGSRPAQTAADALAGDGRHQPGSRKARTKAQQRAKTKAARKQRRRSRSR